MSISFDKAFGVHVQAMQLRADRSQVLANNLANADTPGYKARDVDFKAILQQQAGNTGIRTTHERHIGIGGSGNQQLMYRVPAQPSLDGNTVEADAEQARFSENAMRYEASLTFVERRISGLRNALQGANR